MLSAKYQTFPDTRHAPSFAIHTEIPSPCSSSPFECLRPSRPLKADRPHCSHCHRSSTAMNISEAQRHRKNVEKLLARAPSQQNRPPSHVVEEGARKAHGRNIKSVSPVIEPIVLGMNHAAGMGWGGRCTCASARTLEVSSLLKIK